MPACFLLNPMSGATHRIVALPLSRLTNIVPPAHGGTPLAEFPPQQPRSHRLFLPPRHPLAQSLSPSNAANSHSASDLLPAFFLASTTQVS